jgi:hypothetical protein
MRITESRLRSIIRSVLKENLDNTSKNMNIYGVDFKDLKVHVDRDEVSIVRVVYKIDGKEYSHENFTGSYEGLAYAIMEKLKKLEKVNAGNYEKVQDFLIDFLNNEIYRIREEIFKNR